MLNYCAPDTVILIYILVRHILKIKNTLSYFNGSFVSKEQFKVPNYAVRFFKFKRIIININIYILLKL